MRRIHKVVLIAAVLLFITFTPHACLGQQSAFFQEVFTSRRPGARVTAGLSTGYHQIFWTASGPPGTCLIGLDYSDDGMVWYLGSTIPEHDCTQNGSTQVVGPQHVRFVRMHVTSLAPSVAIRAEYRGYQTNPGGPTGTVTSVFGRTGQVLAVTGDYNVSQVTGAAPLFSPNFQGSPTAPTPSSTDNSNALATTSFVQQLVGSGGGGGGGGNATGLNFGGTIIPMGTPAPTSGQCLTYNGTAIAGGACGTGGGGGLSGSGTANTLSKFTAATTLGDSLLTDTGTALTYTGTGGISASQFNSTGAGPFHITSPVGTLPSLPGSGQNALVSGPDGWYVSNANSAFFKIEPPGTGGTGGAVTSVFGRYGDVLAANNDYSYTQVQNAIGASASGGGTVNIFPRFAGIVGTPSLALADSQLSQDAGGNTLNFAGTGGMTLSNAPSPTSNDNHVATTAWVKANAGTGGGGTTPVPIQLSTYQAPVCAENATSLSTQLQLTSLDIRAGDTVLVTVNRNTTSTVSVTDDGVGGSSTYTSRRSLTINPLGDIFATDPGTAHKATQITVTVSPAVRIVACVVSLTGVTAFGSGGGQGNLGSSITSFTVPAIDLSTAPPGSAIFAAVTGGISNYSITNLTDGTLAGQHSTTAAPALFVGNCLNIPPSPGSAGCAGTVSSSSSPRYMSLALNAGSVTTLFAGPKVVAYNRKNLAITTTASTNSAFFTCSITDCPANGYYRAAWDFLGVSGCSGNPNVNINVDYVDEYNLSANRHTGMIEMPGAAVSGGNHVFGYRHMTVAAPTLADPGQSVAAGLGINVTTSQGACSSGTGTAQVVVTIERLQ